MIALDSISLCQLHQPGHKFGLFFSRLDAACLARFDARFDARRAARRVEPRRAGFRFQVYFVIINLMNSLRLTTFLFIFCLTFILGNFLFVGPAVAALELVRSVSFGTVYYIDSRGVRHPFPNRVTYKSWYGDDFTRVVTVSNEILANYPLAKNITVRPGTFLVKVPTAPQVYAVEQGGVLREIQNESIAAGVYGENWAERVVDIPDVFFGDYEIGNPIVHDYTIPDSILYLDQASGNYFFRNDGILRPFESTQDVLANRFNLAHAIAGNRSYYIRTKPIVGLDKNVFNPVAASNADQRDCQAKNLKAAVIFLTDQKYSAAEVDKVQTIKRSISDRFSWVTGGLAEIDVNYPTSILLDDGYLIKKRNDGTTEVNNETINTFYDNNSDIFDFIIVFTNFKLPSENTNEVASFAPVTNKQEGLNKSLLNRAEVYGSRGKLKGIISMGNINKYQTGTQSGLDETLSVVMHEILHQWSAYVEFIDEAGERNSSLLRSENKQHWSIYAGFISPLGGSGWIDNGNGTFTSGLLTANSNLRKYSQLDLYLMGLIPFQLMEPVWYLEPDSPGAIGNTIAAAAKQVSIDQIIKASGKIKCSLN